MGIKEFAPLFQFASWRVPQFPGAIEYPLEVMEEIRAFACDELLQLSHTGNEVGGVLFGTRREDLVRILTWRPIACDHTQGESLRLSYNDRMNLAVQLELARQNADLKDLRPLGWFVSHLREGVSLSASDLEVYNGFFPEAWQVTLVISPRGSGRAEAGFFVRETDQKLQTECSYRCFDLEPLHPESNSGSGGAPEPEFAPPAPRALAQRDPAPARPVPAVHPVFAGVSSAAAMHATAAKPAMAPANLLGRVESKKLAPPPHEASAPSFPSPSFETEDRLPPNERWLWAIPILLALGIAAFLLYQRRTPAPNAIALRVSNLDQTAQLTWNANSRAIRDSYRGEIDITDGGAQAKVPLTSDQLHAGKMSYQPQSGDIGFEMIVYPGSGDPIHDSTRLVVPGLNAPTQPPQLLPAGPPGANANPPDPVSTNSPAPPPADQSALEREVQQLKLAVGRERARADDLQNLVRILENRLNIQSAGSKTARQR
jgi:proteasome lid subunit RPN8/RPN11